MPDRLKLYNMAKKYNMYSFDEYMMRVHIDNVLSCCNKDEAVERYEALPIETKNLIEEKLRCMP